MKQEELEQTEEELPLHLLQQQMQNVDRVFQQMANRAFTLRHDLEELVSCHIVATLNSLIKHNFHKVML